MLCKIRKTKGCVFIIPDSYIKERMLILATFKEGASLGFGEMSTYKQEMPPHGGYAAFNVLNIYIIAALYACTFVGLKLRERGMERREARRNENREVRLALAPFLIAEQQRMFMKHLNNNREYESELMKGGKGWEVGKWHDTAVYHNPRELWCEPNMYEYYAHLTRREANRQLGVHHEY